MSELQRKLEELNKSDMVPLHMPGHKRNSDAGSMSKYYDIDITEIDGFDNLHDAEDIILEAEKRANKLYGADETHFLVNGSTCGILAAVSATVPRGEKIIASRNCHKSFFHAAYINELELEFVYPQKKSIYVSDDGISSDIYGEVSPEDIVKKIKENPDAKAVFITSPTYEGVPSNIREIAKIVHENNMILIVDEAHGAHFGLTANPELKEIIPENAISQGADIVIHSLHKTLAAMTQTALIHVQGQRANRERLRRFLRIYQTSSPSYVLMSSMDSCVEDIQNRGDEVFTRLVEYKRQIEEGTSDCRHLFVPTTDLIKDPGKVLICSTDEYITGKQIYDILRIEHGIQLEMAGDFYGLAIITGYDKQESIERLINAINGIDKRQSLIKTADNNGKNINNRKADPGNDYNKLNEETNKHGENIVNISENITNFGTNRFKENKSGKDKKIVVTYRNMEKAISFAKAWDADFELVDITKVSGRISADFVNLYPPGIPFIIPGERFDKELIRQISDCINAGMNVQGIEIGANKQRLLKVVKGSNKEINGKDI